MTSRAMTTALKKFEQKFADSFGSDVLRKSSEIKPYEVISTGSLEFDYATGIGGMPEGRVVEWWGPDGTGKTSVALMLVAEAQRKHPDMMVGYIDMEQALDLSWAQRLGVDLDLLYHVQPDSAEDLADIVKMMMATNAVSLVVVDSIGGMITEEEQEKDAEKDVMGTPAKVITRMVKIAAVEARKSNTLVLLINQVRANLSNYGSDTLTGGGWALKHVTTMRWRFRRTGTKPYMIGSGDNAEQVGVEIAVHCEKSKVSPPKRTATFGLFNQETEKYGPLGVDKAAEAADLGLRTRIIKQAKAWYTLPDGQRFNGKDLVVAHFRKNPELVESVRLEAVRLLRESISSEEDETPAEDPVEAGEG